MLSPASSSGVLPNIVSLTHNKQTSTRRYIHAYTCTYTQTHTCAYTHTQSRNHTYTHIRTSQRRYLFDPHTLTLCTSQEARLRELLGRDANALFFPSGSGGGSSSGSSSGVAIAQKDLKSRGSLSGGVGGGDKAATGSGAGGGGGASNDISENLAELEHQIVSQVQQWLKSLSV